MRAGSTWIHEARLGLYLRHVGMGDAIVLGLYSLSEPWGTAVDHAVIVLLPFLPALWLAWRPSWAIALLTLLLHAGMGSLAAWAFGGDSLTAMLSAASVLGIGFILVRARSTWRILDLSPSIRRLRTVVRTASMDPRRSVRFTIGRGRFQRQVRAIRIPHYWHVQIQGAGRRSGLIPLKNLRVEWGPGGEATCVFKGPRHLSRFRGRCGIDFPNYSRYEALAREVP